MDGLDRGPNVAPGLNGTQLFDAQDDDAGGDGPSVIGTGAFDDGLVFQIAADPVLTPHAHEGDHIADPHVIFDPETLLWRMVYSARRRHLANRTCTRDDSSRG